MKKLALTIVLAVLLVGSSAFSSAKVHNLGLHYEDGYTVATIDIDGPVRFSHQTEIAKDGKPFRVIVDILAATHNMGMKEFLELPESPIVGLRTSQYAVSPEKVVRIVLDMSKETVYRMESDANSVRILIPDNAGKKFTSWSSSGWIAAQNKKETKSTLATKPQVPVSEPAPDHKVGKTRSASQLNKDFDQDRMYSLQGNSNDAAKLQAKPKDKPQKTAARKSQSVESSKPVPKPVVKKNVKLAATDQKPEASRKIASKPPVKKPDPVTKPTGTQRLMSDGSWLANYIQPNLSPKIKKAAKVDKPKVKSTPEKTQLASTKASSSTGNLTGPPAPKLEKKAVKKSAKPEAKVNRSAKPKSKAIAKADKPAGQKKQSPVVVAEKTGNNKDTRSSTSRFRRKPAMSKKMRGTMVAEFPKRLVIKYKASSYRDPFETLINDSRVVSSPVQQRLPNVEGLKLVGVIESTTGGRALLEDADGYGYFLKTGDKVKKGYVLRIESDRVYFQIFEYGWSRTVALTIDG